MTARGVIPFCHSSFTRYTPPFLLSRSSHLSPPPHPDEQVNSEDKTFSVPFSATSSLLFFFVFVLFSLPPPLEKRAGGTGEENQQHLQHRWHHLRPEHRQGARPAHHLQERRRRCHGRQRAPEDAPPGGEAPREQEDLQQRQQGRQDVPHRLPSPLCHFQLGLLGHLCEPGVSYQGNDPQTIKPVTQTFHQ